MSYDLPTRRLVSQEDQSMIQAADVPRSKFEGSWAHKTTFDPGLLVPFLCEEIYPGDAMTYRVAAYVRMATPLFPLMDNQRIDTHFFFVPNRLVWDNWQRFMGEQDDPDSSIDYNVPQVESPVGGFAVGSVFDHFELPTVGQVDVAEYLSVSALPLRAYNLIYNQWFRDQNVMDSVTVNRGDAADSAGDYALWPRAKSHDYFTSCLPWPQKFVAPNVPVAGEAPVVGIGFALGAGGTAGPVDIKETDNPATQQYAFYRASNASAVYFETTGAINALPLIYADLEQAAGVSINTLRQTFLVQQLLERDARGGTRYTEIIFSHFRVRSPDARLQRSEYIGGGSTPLQLTPIAQTAPTAGVPLGALGAAGTAFGQHTANYSATEHGFIIGLISVKSELSYSQGINRMWDRRTRYDFYFPSTAGLGEQAVLRREIYATGVPANDQTVFGYQERWHELRTRTSALTGLFRPTATGNIDEWHLSQEFTAPPTLSPEFLYDSPPMARVLAAGEETVGQQYLADILISRTAVRPLPMFGTPVMLGRF